MFIVGEAIQNELKGNWLQLLTTLISIAVMFGVMLQRINTFDNAVDKLSNKVERLSDQVNGLRNDTSVLQSQINDLKYKGDK